MGRIARRGMINYGPGQKMPYYMMSNTSALTRHLAGLRDNIEKLRHEIATGKYPKHAPRGYPTIGSARIYLKEAIVKRGRIIRELGKRHRRGILEILED